MSTTPSRSSASGEIEREDRAREDLRAAFRQRAKEAHPDKGGDADSFQRLKKAFDDALAELSATVAAKGSAPQYDWRRGRTAENAVRLPRRRRQRRASAPPLGPAAGPEGQFTDLPWRHQSRGTAFGLSGCAVDGASSPVVSVATSPGELCGNRVAGRRRATLRLAHGRDAGRVHARECRAKASSSRRVLRGAVGAWFGPCGMPLVAAFADGSLWR